MSQTKYNYDVAFSFVHQDEDLANQLYKLLKDRLSCFIYSEQQKKLAGKDGEAVFNSVFSEESRIVVVLYGKDWGNTKWTKIEETAIRNKGYEDGYDFVLFIPTESKMAPPKWLPKNRIWIGLERWGIESAASIIEARALEFGSEIHIETISEKTARISQEYDERKNRERILDSVEGLKLALTEIQKINDKVHKLELEIKAKSPNWQIRIRENNNRGCDIMCYGYFLTFQFKQQYNNSSAESYLKIKILDGYLNENGYKNDPFNEIRIIEETKLQFSINILNQTGWTTSNNKEKFILSNKLVELWFDKLINKSQSNLN